MKKAADVVLGSPESSTYLREYACGSGLRLRPCQSAFLIIHLIIHRS